MNGLTKWRVGVSTAAALLLAGAIVSIATARISDGTSTYFRGPGGNVVCGYFAGSGIGPLLECGVPGGLNPPPPRPSAGDCHGVDFANNRVRLRPTGKIVGFCSGDVGVLANIRSAPVLAYGTSFHQGKITCSSSVAWLTCTNGSRHGFSLSRLRWRSH